MAHKKAAGSAKNLRDSNPKYRGLKLSGGEFARAGNIIIRQKGDKYVAGKNTYTGKDYTVHAKVDGIVTFTARNFVRFDGRKYRKTICHVIPEGEELIASQLEPKKNSAYKKKESKVSNAVTKTTNLDTSANKSTSETSKTAGKEAKNDDLTKIEGIGPKIAELLNNAGIFSFADLSGSKVGDLRDILGKAGSSFAMHDPKTWKKQATLAKNGKREELKILQDELDGGK